MWNKYNKRHTNLKTKFFFNIIMSLIFCLLLFFLIRGIGDALVNHIYTTESACLNREINATKDFKEYIKENDFSTNDRISIDSWCKKERDVYITIYSDKGRVYATNGKFSQDFDKDDDNLPDKDENTYNINFSNGKYKITLEEYSSDKVYRFVSILSFMISTLLFIIAIIWYNTKILNRIIRLSNQVNEVCNTDLSKELMPDSNDEIGNLIENTNNLRKSIITHYENEKQALQMNNQLIASISHDIRTPLTAIIGYCELMENQKDDNVDELKKYASNCNKKAYQLKNMTDTLFKYFLVYGSAKQDIHKESLNAQMLLTQLISEHIAYLSEQGFNLDFNYQLDENTQIDIDVELIKRVFDNAFSNMQKYADKSNTISIQITEQDNKIIVNMINVISNELSKVESTKLGVKTSKKIMEQLGGDLIENQDGNVYSLSVIFNLN